MTKRKKLKELRKFKERLSGLKFQDLNGFGLWMNDIEQFIHNSIEDIASHNFIIKLKDNIKFWDGCIYNTGHYIPKQQWNSGKLNAEQLLTNIENTIKYQYNDPNIFIQLLKKIQWKHIFWFLLFILLYLGILKINTEWIKNQTPFQINVETNEFNN